MIRLLNINYNVISVAPMMDWTDRHDRYMLRLISKHACLYTEMVTTGAIIHGDQERHLGFDRSEHPVALQLGGSDPEAMAACAKVAQDYGYDEVNINVGCPSDRVQNGRFGACLMAEPETVARCVSRMRESTTLPVTVKTRIGVDDQDSYEDLENFVNQVAASGCDTFIVHARKAWLKGLSPKENRDIPPLDYDRVYLLKEEHPELTIIINGGIQTIDEVESHLQQVDGVMLGRKAYHDPYFLALVEQQLLNNTNVIPSRAEVVKKMLPYIEEQLTKGLPLYSVARHMLGLFHGQYGARQWRRVISEKGHRKGADIAVIEEALTHVNPSP